MSDLRSALDKEFRTYLILLTGDPEMAYETMSKDPNIGVAGNSSTVG